MAMRMRNWIGLLFDLHWRVSTGSGALLKNVSHAVFEGLSGLVFWNVVGPDNSRWQPVKIMTRSLWVPGTNFWSRKWVISTKANRSLIIDWITQTRTNQISRWFNALIWSKSFGKGSSNKSRPISFRLRHSSRKDLNQKRVYLFDFLDELHYAICIIDRVMIKWLDSSR